MKGMSAAINLMLLGACAPAPPPTDPPGDARAPRLLFFADSVADQRMLSVYGGATHVETVASERGATLAIALDRAEFSGATVGLPGDQVIDLSPYRATGGLSFQVLGVAGGEPINVGLLDDQGEGRHVEVRFPLDRWQPVQPIWMEVSMPLRLFGDRGERWDPALSETVPDDFHWDRVQQVRFSAPRAAQVGHGGFAEIRVTDIYIDPVRTVEDPAARWDAFSSTAPEVLLHGFDTPEPWQRAAGPGSRVLEIGYTNPPGSMQVGFEVPTWAEVFYPYEAGDPRRDWSRHWGLALDLGSSDLLRTYRLALLDGSGERWEAIVAVEEGVHTVIVPFRDFARATRGHAEDVIYDERLDLDDVRLIAIGPYQFTGYLQIGAIRLTNARASGETTPQRPVQTTIHGDWRDPIVPEIDPGVLGINAAVWDSDLLADETVARVRRVGHGLARYPGGLTGDEHHWEAELAAADPQRVDTDEFLDWCEAVGARPIFIANFGTGTAEEAARWVSHTRGRVRRWEIGNEVYGEWHPWRASAEDYGRRARAFIVAMKEADPSIEVGIVWSLDDPAWSQEVFARAGDVADAVIVHSYAQRPGDEDDRILLAAANTMGVVIDQLRAAIATHPGRDAPLAIWVTEWSSTADAPGPQTLGVAHAVFVADMLGSLAAARVPVAAYWDIHNGVTPQGGDYGYLSRSFDPAGGNVPRPSYHGFRMAADALRGALYPSRADHQVVASYLTRTPDGRVALLLINRAAERLYSARLDIPGLTGDVRVESLSDATPTGGPTPTTVTLTPATRLALPPRSLTLITASALR